jgi:hypothetical protein
MANTIGVPLLGCASHRFNLAVKTFLKQHDKLLDRIHDIMTDLKTKKKASILRTKTKLIPRTRMDVRWDADYQMIERYLELSPTIIACFKDDTTFRCRLLKEADLRSLENLFQDLKRFHYVSKFLQENPAPDIASVRRYFNNLIIKFPITNSKLASNSTVVNNEDFENGLVKALNFQELSPDESIAISMFLKVPAEDTHIEIPAFER